MAKGDKLTQKDIMIWVMHHPNGTKQFYLLEKEPFLQGGMKKAVHKVGSTGDAVFGYLDQAEAELAKFPPGEDEAAAVDAPESADAKVMAPTGESEEAAEAAADPNNRLPEKP